MQRTTIYFDPQLHKALKIKAAQTEHTVSQVVNEAVRMNLREDAIDLEALSQRAKQPERPFEDFLKELKKNGIL